MGFSIDPEKLLPVVSSKIHGSTKNEGDAYAPPPMVLSVGSDYCWFVPTRAQAFSSIAGITACTRSLSRPAATVG